MGRIRAVKHYRTHQRLKIRTPWLTPNGHLAIRLCKAGKKTALLVHRVVATAFIGDPPKGHQVNHKDSDRANNQSLNLEWVSCSDNHRHAIQKGARVPWLTRNRKLTDDDVHAIRQLIDDGVSKRRLAVRFNVSLGMISHIKSGREYARLPKKPSL